MPRQKSSRGKTRDNSKSKSPKVKPSGTRKPATPHHQTEIEDQTLAGSAILTPDEDQPLLSTGTGAAWDYQPDPQVVAILAEEQAVETGGDELAADLNLHNSQSPILSGGDVDADWERANAVGEEAVGGTVATPDQDRVDELGEAVGLVYQDEEPLQTEEKLQKRDRDRWELNPASDGRPK